MILLQGFRKFFLIITLVLLLGTFAAFTAENSLATTLFTESMSLGQPQIATMNKVESVTKDIEGKAQETLGKVTGDKTDQIMGKVKQAESKVRNAENRTDANFQETSPAVKRNLEAKKNIEAKTEEAIDNSILNPNYLGGGKTNETENQYRKLTD